MKIVYNTILFTLLFLATSCDHSEKIDDIKLEISQNIFRNIDNNGGKITVATYGMEIPVEYQTDALKTLIAARDSK